MSELWKPVRGYESFYEVSSYGRVRSLDRTCRHSDGKVTQRKGRLLKQCLRAGYPFVHLRGETKSCQVHTHRLVAGAFCEKPEGCEVVNHLDGEKTNNQSINLEWTTNGGNSRHAYSTGLNVSASGELHHSSKLTNSQVDEIRTRIIEGHSYRDIANDYGIAVMTISCIKTGRNWSAYGDANIRDKCASARAYVSKGSKHPQSKLEEDEVEKIIGMLCERKPQKEIAKQFGVSPVTVSHINLGNQWSHVRADGCGAPPYFLKYKRRKAT